MHLWLLFCYSFVHYIFRTGVEEEYSERAQLLSELRELYQGEEDKKEETAKAKKRKDADTTMAKDMREACMETYAQSKKRVTQGKL